LAPTKHQNQIATTKILPASIINGDCCSVDPSTGPEIEIESVTIENTNLSDWIERRLDPLKFLPVGKFRWMPELVETGSNLEYLGSIINNSSEIGNKSGVLKIVAVG
jgi:hypothetical protein